MVTLCPQHGAQARGGCVPLDAEVVEVSLLLAARQAAALAALAEGGGLTVGQMIRLLIDDFLRPPPKPGHEGR